MTKKYILTSFIIMIFVFSSALNAAYACCSCADSADEQSQISWDKTIQMFQDQMDTEIDDHKEWIKETWWNENVLQALKGFVGTVTAQKARQSTERIKQAQAVEEQMDAQDEVLRLAETTNDYSPSDLVAAAIEKSAPLTQLGLTSEANTVAFMQSETGRNQTDPNGVGFAKAMEEFGEASLYGNNNAAECSPVEGVYTDCKNVSFKIAALAPDVGIETTATEETINQDNIAAYLRAQSLRNISVIAFAKAEANDATGGLGSLNNAKWEQIKPDANETVALAGEDLNNLSRGEFIQTAAETSDSFASLNDNQLRELLLSAVLSSKITDAQRSGSNLLSFGSLVEPALKNQNVVASNGDIQ